MIDNDLVPGLEGETLRGRAREYDGFEAFVIAMAAKLLDAGINKARVRQIMEGKQGAERSRAAMSFWQDFQKDTAGFAVWACNDSVDIRTNTIKLLDTFRKIDGT